MLSTQWLAELLFSVWCQALAYSIIIYYCIKQESHCLCTVQCMTLQQSYIVVIVVVTISPCFIWCLISLPPSEGELLCYTITYTYTHPFPFLPSLQPDSLWLTSQAFGSCILYIKAVFLMLLCQLCGPCTKVVVEWTWWSHYFYNNSAIFLKALSFRPVLPTSIELDAALMQFSGFSVSMYELSRYALWEYVNLF